MIETNTVYVLNAGHRQGVLFPDEDGVPTFPKHSPLATLAAYVSAGQADDNDFDSAHKDINQGSMLLVFHDSPDGAPRRCAWCFTFKDVVQNAPWQDHTQHHGATLRSYEVT